MQVTSAPFNEKLIVQYLLGELPEEQQVEIEDCAFQDQECLEHILNVENDLIDQYVRGEISSEQRQRFERHFLASAERRRKLEFARALVAVAAEVETPQAVPLGPAVSQAKESGFLAFIRGLNPVVAWSLAAAALILIVGPTWFIRDNLRLRAQVNQLQAERATRETQRRQLEDQLAAERTRSESLTSQLQEQKNVPTPPAPELPQTPTSSPVTVALSLLPGLARGENTASKLLIEKNVSNVNLRVGINPQDDYPLFRVEIHGPGNEQIFSRGNLSARKTRSGRGIVLNLPARVFSAGRYELSLKGTTEAGSTDDVGYYYFEVVKK